MKIPVITGLIDRRILVNYRLDPELAKAVLPEPFEPVTHRGYAMAGICLIRLKSIRPKCSVPFLSIDSENAAHRFAVKWKEDGNYKEGVYIPRRDTSSLINSLAGGNIFPGVHHHAAFKISETETDYELALKSKDNLSIAVKGTVSSDLPETSIFESVEEASQFFENGCVGYSDTSSEGRYDGLELRISNWSVKPLEMHSIHSSYFEDREKFPEGRIEFDHALLMLEIEHEWHGMDDLCIG